MSAAMKSMRGYFVLVRGLESKNEWEAAYTLVFTNKKKAMRELARCRRDTNHEYRLGVVTWEASA
ncbi:hypothetical protein ACFXG4_03910 [Nocardia sp. NPDC059246]|uniref:hypothetical protein n=1 Tax=unclassified Nocardia TaxID=2637762 RepID=UPI0036912E77